MGNVSRLCWGLADWFVINCCNFVNVQVIVVWGFGFKVGKMGKVTSI